MVEAALTLTALAGAILVASVCSRLLPTAGDPLVGGCYRNLDGVRALCAMVVVLAHAKGLYNLHIAGQGYVLREGWDAHLSQGAELGVFMFFQITGFLFWDKVLTAGGALPIRRHLGSRVRRLVPLYVLFAVAALGFALYRSGFQLHPGGADLLRAVVGTFSFGFLHVPGFNRDFLYSATIDITWTLAYEWCFYAALPLLALLYRRRLLAVVVVGYVVYQVASPTQWNVANFAFGMAVAALRTRWMLRGRWDRGAPLLGVALLAVGYLRGWPPVAELGLAILLCAAVYGTQLDRVLQQRGLALIGKVSYSVYLLHCLLMYHFLWSLRQWGLAGELEVVQTWMLIAAMATGVVLLSVLTYYCVERPFMRPVPAKLPPGRVPQPAPP